MLNKALGYAAQGWPVFPVMEGEKRPACANGFHDASLLIGQITEWWSAMPNANIGFCPADAGLMVIDYDCDSDTAEQFAVDHGLPLTMTVNTPGGGYHEYYHGTVPSSVGKVGKGIDIRSKGGYVLLPGSVVNGKAYESIHGSTGIAIASKSLLAACAGRKEAEAKDDTVNIPWNLGANSVDYIEWLRYRAKVPKEGQRNTVLASTAAMGRSYAIDADLTIDLIKQHWNPRLENPLEEWEIEQSGRSGHRSATSPQGNMTQAYRLGGVFKPIEKGENRGEFRFVDREGVSQIKPPEWLISDMLAQDSYTILFGAPGSYKTFLALDIALSIAAGHDEWLNGKAIMTKGPVMYVAGEGRSGIRQRIEAWEYENNDRQQVDGFYLVDPVPLVSRGFRSFIEAAKEVEEHYTLVILDTVSRTLAGQNENAQEAVSALTLQVDALRRELGASVMCIHHTGHKQPGQDALRERGSSVFRADADTVLLMDDGELSMIKQKEAEAWEKPLTLVPVKALNSLVLDIPEPDTPLVEQVKKQKKVPANQAAAEKVKAQAFLKEELAARLLGSMPKGAKFSTAKAAEFMAGAEPNGIAADTWRKYLGVLKAHDTKVRDYYDISTTQWVNR